MRDGRRKVRWRCKRLQKVWVCLCIYFKPPPPWPRCRKSDHVMVFSFWLHTVFFILLVLTTWPKDKTYQKFRFNQNEFLDFHGCSFNMSKILTALFTLIINLSQSLIFFPKHIDSNSKPLFHHGNKTHASLGIYSISLVSFVLYGVFLLIHYWVSVSPVYSGFFTGLILQLKWRKTKGFERLSTIEGISMALWRKTSITHWQ